VTRRATAVALAVFCAVASLAREASATRFALLIGNNEGQRGDTSLRFAEDDTARLSELLRRLGGFERGGTVMLLAHGADDVRGALAALAERIRATAGEHLVLVFYSGHADAQALHLGSTSLPLTELRETVAALPAATRVLILDACQAGVLTRPKGGAPGAGFEISFGKGEEAKGLAILASSSGSELSQESDELRASVFTHYLEVGLAGLADRNRDGIVSLGEVFDYTADRTLAATLGTTTGPQHPTFRVDLSGRDDLALTRPGSSSAGYGRLRLDVAGWYFVRRADGSVAAEVTSNGSDSLALEPGQYQVSRRERDRLDVASVAVADGVVVAISGAPARSMPFGQMVRKGGGRKAAYALAVASAARTGVEDLGPSLGGALAARADLSAVSLELRLALGRAHEDVSHLASTTWDTSAAAAALRIFDLPASTSRPGLSWGIGIEAGAAYMSQRLDDGAQHGGWNPFAGPTLLGELALGRRYFLRATLDAPVYMLLVESADGAESRVVRPAIAASLGGGVAL